MKRTNSQLISDCYAAGGSPVVSAGGAFVSCSLPQTNLRRFNAEGFYSASGNDALDMAQKNIADATKNLQVAQKIASDVLTRYNKAIVDRDIARSLAQECDAKRAQHNTGFGKNRACGNRGSLYSNWNTADRNVASLKATLDSANAAVTKANDALLSAQNSAEKIRNSDPNYALGQQKLIADQNAQQASLNASVAKQAGLHKTTMYILIGAGILVLTGLFVWMKKSKTV
jgi:hypothetical protein